LGEALEHMPFYKKIHERINRKTKPRDDDNITLAEGCGAILQRKFPPKLNELGSFTIPCFIGKFNIGRVSCDMGASINLNKHWHVIYFFKTKIFFHNKVVDFNLAI
jgi:hypothetical protein